MVNFLRIACLLVSLALGPLGGPKNLWARQPDPRLFQALALENEAAQYFERGEVETALRKARNAAQLYEMLGEPTGQAACLLLQGWIELQRERYSAAVPALESALALYLRQKVPVEQIAEAHLFLGQSFSALGRRDEAVTSLLEAASWFRRSSNSHLGAMGLSKTAQVEVRLGRVNEAAVLLEESLPTVRATGSVPQIASFLQSLAEVYQLQGRNDRALALAEESLRLEPDPITYKTLGSIYVGKSLYQKALEAFEQAERLHPADPRKLWVIRVSKAQVYYIQGRLSAAAKLYGEAVKALREMQDKEHLPVALTGLGVIYRVEGRLAEARLLLEEALNLRRTTGDRRSEAVALNNLALVDVAGGGLDEGLAKFEQSLVLRRETGDRGGEATGLVNTGHLLFELGRVEEAEVRFRKALEICRELNPSELEVTVLQHLAELSSSVGRSAEALETAEQALDLARQRGLPRAELAIVKLQGLFWAEQRNLHRALSLLAQATKLAQSLGDRETEAETLGIRGLSLWLSGSGYAAEPSLKQLVAMQEEAGRSFFLDLAFLALGLIEKERGHIPEAIQYLRRSIESHERIANQTLSEQLLQGLGQTWAQSYQFLASLLVSSGDVDGAFAVAERARARAFLRQLANRRPVPQEGGDANVRALERSLTERLFALNREIAEEKEKPFDQQAQGLLDTLNRQVDQLRREYENVLIRLQQTQPEYALLVRPEPLGVADVQRLLPEKTTLIEYFLTPETLLIWVIDRQSSRLFQQFLPEKDLENRVQRLREQLSHRENGEEIAAGLFRDLIAPVLANLPHENLWIVPHRALHSLPFAALRDEKGDPLISRFRVTLLPSASVVPFLRGKRSPNEGKLLALGDPDGSLPFAGREAKAVAELYGTAPLLGAEARETALRRAGPPADVLHLAAHATFDSARPLFSSVELSPGEGSDGRLELHEALNLDLTGTNLVVLSGCATGMAEPTRGDDLSGFVRAFLYAGAPSVLATLWPVDDEATEVFMRGFHRRLRDGMSPARALQAAQREIAGQERWQSPYFWAGFVLSGDDGEP